MIIHEDDKGFGFLLTDTARLLRKLIDRRLQPFGLTRAQWAILAILANRDGLSQSDLAEELEIERSTVGRLIDHVAARGWIERRPVPGDRRLWLVHLTGEAKPIIARVTQIIVASRLEMLQGLSAEQHHQLEVGLACVKANLAAALDTKTPKTSAGSADPDPPAAPNVHSA